MSCDQACLDAAILTGFAITGAAVLGGLVEAAITYTVYLNYKEYKERVTDEEKGFLRLWIDTHKELFDEYRKYYRAWRSGTRYY